MKKILFASTALAALAIGGAASAEIALFGSARLGLGYNINNEGGIDLEDGDTETVDIGGVDTDVVTSLKGTDDFRAVSRIRWGVIMTGESDSGITFGASIRADNANGGGTGASAASGQVDGDVFVSGAWGTLTFGDTNAADEQHVGDASGNYALTGLGDFNETPFISNGGGFGDSDSIQFADNPEARPTVRYDYNFGGFGVSASTNRNLNDIGVGASYTADFAGGSVTGGVGYYDFSAFDTNIRGVGDVAVKGGEQWSVGMTGNFGGFSGGVVYTAASSEADADEASGDLDVLNVGMAYTFDAWTVGAYYANVLTGNGNLDAYDGKQSYGASVEYDLGGGASVNFGVAQTYGRDAIGDPGDDGYAPEIEDGTVADFGIKMNF